MNGSVKAWTIEKLEAGKSITELDLWDERNCRRLATYIHELRKEGWDIETEMVYAKNRSRYAVYRMKGR